MVKRSAARGAKYESETLPKVAAQYERGFKADEVMRRLGVTNQPAGDCVGYVLVKGGYVAEITEITVGNKSFDELRRQFEGAKKLVAREFGEAPIRYDYVVRTNNKRLVDAPARADNRIPFGDQKRLVKVIYDGGAK